MVIRTARLIPTTLKKRKQVYWHTHTHTNKGGGGIPTEPCSLSLKCEHGQLQGDLREAWSTSIIKLIKNGVSMTRFPLELDGSNLYTENRCQFILQKTNWQKTKCWQSNHSLVALDWFCKIQLETPTAMSLPFSCTHNLNKTNLATSTTDHKWKLQ